MGGAAARPNFARSSRATTSVLRLPGSAGVVILFFPNLLQVEVVGSPGPFARARDSNPHRGLGDDRL